MHLTIPHDLFRTISDHLLGTYPNEGGGFLVGTLNGDERSVSEVHPVLNVFDTEEQFHRFLAEDGAFQRIEDDADARGLTLLGYFHSHPDSPAYPSEFDRVHALPFFAYLIVGVTSDGVFEYFTWELTPDRTTFVPAALTIQEPIR